MASSRMTCVPMRPSTTFSRSKKMCMHCLIEEEGIVLMPGIFDALFAGVLQISRFKARFVFGYVISTSRLDLYLCLQFLFGFWYFRPLEMSNVPRAICAATPNGAFIVNAVEAYYDSMIEQQIKVRDEAIKAKEKELLAALNQPPSTEVPTSVGQSSSAEVPTGTEGASVSQAAASKETLNDSPTIVELPSPVSSRKSPERVPVRKRRKLTLALSPKRASSSLPEDFPLMDTQGFVHSLIFRNYDYVSTGWS
ncbi:petal death protein-like [Zingiber officinale]|uniref:petal death protein-like n=1 Tax=Zingiber officinale TaxID=94328 RepID=UPI001C4B1A15|nr:petal death protein-like [Zingiber officinale]